MVRREGRGGGEGRWSKAGAPAPPRDTYHPRAWCSGPNPLTYLLGALVGCTDYTAAMVAKERGHKLR